MKYGYHKNKKLKKGQILPISEKIVDFLFQKKNFNLSSSSLE